MTSLETNQPFICLRIASKSERRDLPRTRILQFRGGNPVFLGGFGMLHYNPLFVCVLEQKQEWLLLFWLTNLHPEFCSPKHHIPMLVKIQQKTQDQPEGACTPLSQVHRVL